MGNDDKDITLQMVMDHVSNMKYDLEKKLGEKIDSVARGLGREIDGLAHELREFRAEFREFAKGVEELDDRVQDIENAKLPERVKGIELRLAA